MIYIMHGNFWEVLRYLLRSNRGWYSLVYYFKLHNLLSTYEIHSEEFTVHIL